MSPGPTSREPRPGGDGPNARDHRPFRRVVVQRRLDLACQRVVVGGGLVRALDDRDRARAADRRTQLVRGERPEARERDTADRPTEGAEMVDDGGRRVRHRAHRDHDLGGVLAAVRLDGGVAATGQDRPLRKRRVQLAREATIESTLADATFHVAVLVLDDAGHQRARPGRTRSGAARAGRRRTRAGARPRAGPSSRACASSGTRPGRRRTAPRWPRRRAGRSRRGRRPPGRCGRTGSPTRCRRRP